MKKTIAIVAALLVVTLLTGCFCAQPSVPKVAVLLPSVQASELITEEQIKDAELAMEGMSGNCGVHYIFRTFDDAEEQAKVINSAIGWGASAIVLSCVDTEAMYDDAKSILDAGVKLILCGPSISGLNATAYFTLDSVESDVTARINEILTGENASSVLCIGEPPYTGKHTIALTDKTREGAKAAVAAWLASNEKDVNSAISAVVAESDAVALGAMDAFDAYKGKLKFKYLVSEGGDAYKLANGKYDVDNMISIAYGADELPAAVQLACSIALGDETFGGIAIGSNMTFMGVPVYVR